MNLWRKEISFWSLSIDHRVDDYFCNFCFFIFFLIINLFCLFLPFFVLFCLFIFTVFLTFWWSQNTPKILCLRFRKKIRKILRERERKKIKWKYNERVMCVQDKVWLTNRTNQVQKWSWFIKVKRTPNVLERFLKQFCFLLAFLKGTDCIYSTFFSPFQ